MKTKYRNLLKTEEWKTFRSRILELDNYTCTKCNTCYKEEPSNLNIHHKVYYLSRSSPMGIYPRRCHNILSQMPC